MKPFEIQGAQLKLGGVQLEAGTTGVVIPGVTRATSFRVEEVEDTGDQTQVFDPAKVTVIDYVTYQELLNETGNGSTRADYITELDNDGYIDDLEAGGTGSYTQQESADNASNDMYGYIGSGLGSDRPIVAQDWVQIPFRPKMRAGQVEREGGNGGGATELNGLDDVEVNDPQGGQSLVYNANSEKWENGTPSGSGSGSLTISDGNGISISNVSTILIDSNNFVNVGEGAVGLTNLGGGGSSTKFWTNPNENTWRIEEYNGGAAVNYEGTPITSTITATATETLSDVTYVDIDDSTFPGFYGGSIMSITINGIDYGLNGNEWLGGGTTYRYHLSATTSYTTGDTITATIQTGSNPPQPVVWWDASNSTNGNDNFRGAIIEYHAYCDRGTAIGKIIIAADDENAITHMEAMSGSSNLSEYEFWYAPEYGQVAVRRIGTSANDHDNQIWIQWTSKIFYGSEYYC